MKSDDINCLQNGGTKVSRNAFQVARAAFEEKDITVVNTKLVNTVQEISNEIAGEISVKHIKKLTEEARRLLKKCTHFTMKKFYCKLRVDYAELHKTVRKWVKRRH